MRLRVKVVDHVPHARPQRTPPPAITPTIPVKSVTYEYPVSEHVGRIPLIGLDSGAIPKTRPDHIDYDKKRRP